MRALLPIAAVLGIVGLAYAMGSKREKKTASGTLPPAKTPAKETISMPEPVELDGDQDVIFSFMAIRPEWMPEELSGARLIEVPGVVAEGHSNPGWSHLSGLKVNGSVIRGLLNHYGIKNPRRIAAFGFSAGSNAGLRELLKNEADRQTLSMVAAIDGLHPRLNPYFVEAGDIKDHYQWYDEQVKPFFSYAMRAAMGDTVLVATASNVAAPIINDGKVSKTADAWGDIDLMINSEYSGPLDNQIYPYQFDTAKIVPDYVGGVNDFTVFYYPGEGKQAHIDQAQIVGPLILKYILAPYWQDGEVGA